jgi:hypothetical protein
MSTNLEGYKRNNNKDWSEWVKLVKKAYKSQGHTLTQQQALIIAKQSYPGKGNVIGRETELEGTVPVKGDEIPENPVRRKKEPAPKKEPRVQKERGRRERDEEPRRRRKYVSESDESDEEPRRRERHSRKRDERDDERIRETTKKIKNVKISSRKRKSPEECYSSDESSEDERQTRRRKRYVSESDDSDDEPRRRKEKSRKGRRY